MSTDDIQRDLMAENSHVLLVLRPEQSVRSDFSKKPTRILGRFQHKLVDFSDFSADDDVADGDDLLKIEEFLQTKKKCQFDKYVRAKFPLIAGLARQKDPFSSLKPETAAVRLKDRLLGAVLMVKKEINDKV